MILNKLKNIAQVIGLVGIILLSTQGILSILNGEIAWAEGSPLLGTNSTEIAPAAPGERPLLQWDGSTVPLVTHYQGFLRDAEGNPLSGYYTITLRIYDDVITSTSIYTETHYSVTVRSGYFNVLLGNNNPDGSKALPANLFTSPDRFIGVTVDPYEEMDPRQRFASVAYTFQAERAHQLQDVVYVDGDNEVGIGTASPNRAVTIQSGGDAYMNIKSGDGAREILIGADSATGIVSTMTNHDLQLRAGGNSTKMTVKANGQIGIGTTNPASKLEIQGGDIAISDNTHRRGKIRLWKEANSADAYVSHAIGTEAFYSTYGPGASYGSSIGHKFYVHGNELAARIGVGSGGTPPNRLDSQFYGNVRVDGEFRIQGNKPIQFHRFYVGFDNQDNFDTGISAAQYVCGVAGWAAVDADIQEGNGGDYIVETFSVGFPTWRIRARFHTQSNHEDWYVTLICVDSDMAEWVGPVGPGISTNTKD